MTRTTGRSAFLSLLKDEGITHLFGNPGTTELPVMHALMDHPELTYVMAMQESLVVAMADGFSRASGKYASRPKSIIYANDRFAPEAVISNLQNQNKPGQCARTKAVQEYCLKCSDSRVN